MQTDDRQRCPACSAPISRPAGEGGVLLRNRYVRITPAGELVLGCPGCAQEVARAPLTGRFVLHVGGSEA